MEKKEKKSTLFWRILTFLFIVFLCLYAVSSNGYVEKVNKEKTLFTEEQIKQFEKDVNNGTFVDLNDYIEEEKVDYSNRISKLGEDISNIIDYSADKSLDYLKSLFSYLFE